MDAKHPPYTWVNTWFLLAADLDGSSNINQTKNAHIALSVK